MRILLLSMPDASEHTPTLAIRMPNGGLASLAGNLDPHHDVAIADLVLAQSSVRQTVERLVGSQAPDVVGLSVMTFQRVTARRVINLVRQLRPSARIVVLILFGIMLTRAPVGRRVLDNTLRARVGAFVIGGGVFVMLTVFLAGAFGESRIDNQAPTATAAIGESLFRTYVLPFEAVSVLLLAALIGAIVLARRD